MPNRSILSAATLALVILSGLGASVADKLRVVATTPDFAALARDIGGDAVEVTALAKPSEDPHYVDAKPSHVVTLNRADVLIEGGVELELGWLPPLLENSRNAKIAAGAPGRIVASHGVQMLEIPVTFDRSRGDVHSLGNPHFMMDPVNVRTVAGELADRFARLRPADAAVYRANLAKFEAKLGVKLAEWQRRLEPYHGAKLVTYHRDFGYLAERFGLVILETLEPKPGIAPSPAHIAKVIDAMRSTSARVILVQPYQNRRTAEAVARQAGALVIDMPQQPGARPNTQTYFDMMDYLVATLASALGSLR